MKILPYLTMIPIVYSSCLTAENIIQVKGVGDKQVIRSVNSDLCHVPTSRSRGQLKILDDQSNVYDSLDECLIDGGKLSDAMKIELGREGPMVLEEKEKAEQKGQSTQKFAGINWGLGLAITWLDTDIISDVTIENGTVRVNEKTNNRAIAMVESHYFWTPNWLSKNKTMGIGPYVALGLLGTDGIDPLSTYGFGLMLGKKRDDLGNSWNLGIGVFVDTQATHLRDGVVDGGTTEETDPEKLLVVEDDVGGMLMFSANF